MEVFVHKQHRLFKDLMGGGDDVVHALVADGFIELFIDHGHAGRCHKNPS